MNEFNCICCNYKSDRKPNYDRHIASKFHSKNEEKYNQLQGNNKLIEAILKTCNSKTKLCIAANITAQNENIITKSIEEWKSLRINYDKQPTIFLLG